MFIGNEMRGKIEMIGEEISIINLKECCSQWKKSVDPSPGVMEESEKYRNDF